MKRVALALLVAACGDVSDTPSPDAAPDSPAEDPITAALPPAPADWLFLFDRSVSWFDRSDRFAGLVSAVSGYATAHPASIELAATSFPRFFDANPYCTVPEYKSAELPWGATDQELVDTLDLWSITSGGSTLGPALRGAGDIAREYRDAHAGRSTSIILLTDAAPNEDEECESSDWASVASIAASVFDGGRGPTVSIINVMGTAIGTDHWAKLGAIATAGGGYAAFVNGSESDVKNSTAVALADLTDRAMTCTRSLPAGFVPATITVTSPDGSVTELSRATDGATCTGNTFYLDDPTSPTTATLCSGPGGVGGICELTFYRAQTAGAPTFIATQE